MMRSATGGERTARTARVRERVSRLRTGSGRHELRGARDRSHAPPASRALFAVVLLALLTSSRFQMALAAGSFYVDAANPSCSNSGPGTPAVPYCRISAASAARGGPGTTLLVKPAVYREQIDVAASGASGSPFALAALGSPVVLDGADDFSAT